MKRWKRKALIPSLVVMSISAGIIVLVTAIKMINNSDYTFARQLKSFTVTIHNQSDYDIVSIEIDASTGKTNYSFEEKIRSGKKKTIKPELSISGETVVYLKYTDSEGKTASKSVCSYTEQLSGYSTVYIKNDGMKVEENCY